MDFLYSNLDKVQLSFIFLNSFLLSRLIIKTRVPERLVWYLIGKKHLPVLYIILYIIFASAFLSCFIPNVITVLTLLPVIKILGRTLEESLPGQYKEIETLLPLSIVYGANIGGMGSITGTPANGILVVYATLRDVPGREYLSFAFWLFWGIPLVMVFVLVSWGVLAVSFRLWGYNNDLIHITFSEQEAHHPLQREAIRIIILFFLLSVFLSALMQFFSGNMMILELTGISTLVLVILLFFMPIRDPQSDLPQRFLRIRDCYSNLPVRGLVFIGILFLLAGIVSFFDLQRYMTGFFSRVIRVDLPILLLFLLISLLTSLSTELFSNTLAQLAMFTVVIPVFGTTTLTAIQALLIVTLSCTSAFMSPIATGVNSLAFGEMRGISLSKILTAGLIMKFLGAVIISCGVLCVFGWVI